MVKVDFNCSYGVIDAENKVHSDIQITVNAETEEHGELSEEGVDVPVVYETEGITEKDIIVMPEYIPDFVDISELQDLRYFNIDGYWYSDDLQYVFRIYTKTSDSGFNSYAYTNLKTSGHIEHGTIQQLSSYSVRLMPRRDSETVREVFATPGQLKGDDLVLTRVDDSIVNNVLGTWWNDDATYRFEDDGKYYVESSRKSYWGYYFIVDETKIVLGEHSDGLDVTDYSIDGNVMVINGRISLERQ